MPLNLSTIKPAVLKAKEVATQEYVDNTTASALANSGFVLPKEVAAAINNNTTTIDGSKITTWTIQAGAIAAGAITTDMLSLKGNNNVYINKHGIFITDGTNLRVSIGNLNITKADLDSWGQLGIV